MTRWTSTVDRFAALVCGVALLAAGVGMLVWNTGWVPDTPRMITARGWVTATGTSWWPWAVAAAGTVLVVIALWWLLSHRPKSRIKALPLSGGPAGTISTDLGEVADAAARVLEQHPDVVSAAKGRAIVDRGVRTVDLVVTTRMLTNMSGLIEVIDSTCVQIAQMLGDMPVASRTSIHIEKRASRRGRVA